MKTFSLSYFIVRLGEGGGKRLHQAHNLCPVLLLTSDYQLRFIVCDDVQQDIFVYQTHLVGRIALQQGEMVTFDYVMDNNRPQASLSLFLLSSISSISSAGS